MSLLFHLYGTLWRCAVPWLRRQKRFTAGFESREVPSGWPWDGKVFSAQIETLATHTVGQNITQTTQRPKGQVIWVQAASAGEAWLVHPLANALDKILETASPSVPLTLLCTSFTPQGLDILKKIQPTSPHLKVVVAFFPLDHPKIMGKAFQQTRPDAIVLLETELWPGLLCTAKNQHVPVLVCNARMTPKSLRSYKVCKNFWRNLAPTQILATAKEDAIRFSELFNCPVDTMKNIKFDRAFDSLQTSITNEQALRDKICLAKPSSQNIILALASVREEEETMLADCIKRLSQKYKICFMVAPRHQSRISAWEKLLEEAGLCVMLRSELLANPTLSRPIKEQETPPDMPKQTWHAPLCILWDTFGDLCDLYLMADVAFVGGSLAPLGGQNFLEALEAGLPTHTGPHLKNFLWASHDLQATSLLNIHAGVEELVAALDKELHMLTNLPEQDWEYERQARKSKIRFQFTEWLRLQTGGSQQCAKIIFNMLNKNSAL